MEGAWPFVTRRELRHPDGSLTSLHSRHHRKGLSGDRLWEEALRSLPSALWLPTRLNWWIGAVFALGAALFAVGALLCLFPEISARLSLSNEQVNSIFFAGSIPFTTAAWLQLTQSANAGSLSHAGESRGRRYAVFGWYPTDAGWLSCALQFAGTLLFNINTFDAMVPPQNWQTQEVSIWLPDVVGSVFFLVSGYLAFIETCHRHWAWLPHLLAWRISFINLLGCMFFMISALFSFVTPHPVSVDTTDLSLLFTLLGAIAFFIGAILLLPEAATDQAAPSE